MAPVHHNLFARRSSNADSALTPAMLNLLIALLVLVFLGLMLVAALLILRNHRRSRKEAELPLYNEKSGKRNSNHRRLTITAAPFGKRSEPVFVYDEKRNLVENSSSPPESPIPEIRITFPEEEDEGGKRKSGRVLVVHVGDKSVGMEPLEEDLPPYRQGDDARFQSLDLERIGGLKEKEFEHRFS